MNRLFKKTIHYKDFTSKDIEQFALSNGYRYIKSEATPVEESGYYMGPTHYNEKVDIVRWEKNGIEYEFYTRFWSSEAIEKLSDWGEEKKRDRLLLGLTFSIKLPYKLPSVMVQTITSRTIWNAIGLTELFIGKKVKLEGDFNQFFKVYTPSGEAPNAFVALAPDTMVKMLRAGSGMDFQFAGNRIYFNYDIRFQTRNFKSLWGFLGDNIKVTLDKDIHTQLIEQSEWQKVFARSYEYSTDITRAFRALKQPEQAQPLRYISLTGKNIGKIFAMTVASLIAVIAIGIWLPLLLALILFLLVANGLYRYIAWNKRRKALLKAWDYGIISAIVR